MLDRTVAIVFRNPQPQRSPIRAKLYVLRVDGSSAHTGYPDQGNSITQNEGAGRSNAPE
jgi:hypothetical protein